MRPEPISRFAPDGLLQTTGEALGYLAICRLLGSFGNQIEEHFAISPGCPFQFTIKDGEVHQLGNALGAIHEHGVLIQESGPIMGLAAVGRLVRNQADGYLPAFTAKLYHFACRGMFRHIVSSEPGADMLKHLVQILIA